MKIDGSKQTQQTAKSPRKSQGSGVSDTSFGSMVSGEAAAAGGAAATQSIAHVDSLLAVQGAENPTERASRGRMRHRADQVLNALDVVHMALLNGTLTVGHVVDIADVVASHREKIMDPQLTAVLDEIDLRAQVELAKMRVSLGN